MGKIEQGRGKFSAKMLSENRFIKVLKSLKSKKFGVTVYSISVEEISVEEDKTVINGKEYSAGNYFNVSIDYVI